MNSDAMKSLAIKVAVMILTALATQLHISGGAGDITALATDLVDAGFLIYGVYRSYGMKIVPHSAVAIDPHSTMDARAPVGSNVAGKVVGALLFAFVLSAFLVPRAFAADVAPASKAISQALSYNYPSTKCGLYYGVNTMGSTGSVNNAQVGTQVVQGDIGLTLGYTCPMGKGYWFVDASADFANFNGSQNGFSVTGPAAFMERFGFGAPIDLVMSMIPGLSSLQNAVPSLIPLPTGIAVVTSNPYLFGAVHQEDVGLNFGLASNKQWLISAGFGIGNKTRLSNGVVFDPFVEYILPSSRQCFGPLGGSLCSNKGSQVNVGMILEF
jgi:hypothetical protein